MQHEQTYTVSVRHKDVYTVKNNRLQNLENITIKKLVKLLTEPQYKIKRYTVDQYYNLSDEEQKACKVHIPYFVGSHFNVNNSTNECIRKTENFKERNLLTYDIDYADNTTLETLKNSLHVANINYIIYTSISHNPNKGKYRYRLVIPIIDMIYSRKDYHSIYRYVCDLLHIPPNGFECIFDSSASLDLIRAMFLPVTLSDQKLESYYCLDNNFLKIDKERILLDEKKTVGNVTLDHKLSPQDMSGMQGTFNATYTALEILYLHGQDKYAPEDPDDPLDPHKRWFYRLGSSRSGIRFYDNGNWLHSDHDSDPLNVETSNYTKKQWDAFSLYTFLKFGNDQDKALDSLSQDPKVMAKLAEEFKDFDIYLEKKVDTKVVDYISEDDIAAIIRSRNPKEILKFIIDRVYIYIDKGTAVFLLPTESMTFQPIEKPHSKDHAYIAIPKRRFITLKPSVTGFEGYFGNCGTFSDPHNPKKKIPPYTYAMKYCNNVRRYLYKVFMPYNKFSKQGLHRCHTSKTAIQLNTFSGFPFEPDFNYGANQDAQEAITTFKTYVLNILCQRDEALYTWLMDWIADIFQNPEIKKGTSVIFYSKEQGTGKSTLFKLLSHLLGDSAQIIKSKTLTGNFNAQLETALLASVDDINFQSKSDSSFLKSIITELHLAYEKKNIDADTGINYTRIIITSNHLNMVALDSLVEERRYTFVEVPNCFQTKQFFEVARMSDEDRKNYSMSTNKKRKYYFTNLNYQVATQASAILAWLLDREITSNLNDGYRTQLYNKLEVHNQSPIDACLLSLKHMNIQLLEDIFNSEFGEVNVKFTDKNVWIKKSCMIDYFNQEFKVKNNITPNNFLKLLRDSIVVKRHNLGFTDATAKKFCNSVLNGKYTSCISFPVSFFSNLNSEINKNSD